MAKPCDIDEDWSSRKERIIGLGERSFHKSYYPQLRQNLDRLERFHTLLDSTSDFVIMVSLPDGIITDANATLERLMGQSVDKLIGTSFEALNLGDATHILDVLRQEMTVHDDSDVMNTHSMEIEFTQNDELIWLEFSYGMATLDGQHYGVMVGRDVTERKRNHETLAALYLEKEAMLDNAVVGIAMVRYRRFISCNRRFEELFGYKSGEAIGQSTRIMYESDDAFMSLGEEAYGSMLNDQHFRTVQKLLRMDGSPFWCEMTGNALDQSHPNEGSVWMLTDVTERKQAEERALYLSYHDALTGLPNQLLLQDRVQQAIMFSARTGTHVALLVVDLDRFKTINDILGHHMGNRLLVEVGKRLNSLLQGTDTVCRQGGDEFILLLTDLPELEAVGVFLRELIAHFAESFQIDGHTLTTSISVGAAIYPEDGADFETLLKKADMAMYWAKDAGRNTYRFFSEDMNSESLDLLMLHAGLRQALASGQFVLHYQPQINIATGALIGAEALIRWNHPELGLVSPGRFIPVAEETGLIVEIGDWVLHEACRTAAKWREAGMFEPVVAVNLSALQFKRGDIESSVVQALTASGIEPAMLELELTESILLKDTEHVLATVQRLKQMGIKLSIDDFGTGYSSLSYLKRFRVDKLKIDQSFIRELAFNAEDAAIVRAIIQMARSLGLSTIAEGVESQRVLELLRLYHCDEVQGYFISRPMPADAFMAFLTDSLIRQKTQ
ncbi:putative bifunctional diguanylate cyclase/phosphodiesterase [Tolumonas lignilytica]|uniref:putative bifunctional diguanylate cyclase/phosphodiesterase n=1 Tax=Tolumonas lignilytica TaxID=1283284 RepID=UPI0004640CD3|nr:bifunctional diguanylate cyclase/phosphodiesterase [Tolumonas lignilytica]